MSPIEVAIVAEIMLDSPVVDETENAWARQLRGREFIERASRSLAGGATSNCQIAEQLALWSSHGFGSKSNVYDGKDYSDFHGGYGACPVGHAHPATVAAGSKRVTRGMHFLAADGGHHLGGGEALADAAQRPGAPAAVGEGEQWLPPSSTRVRTSITSSQTSVGCCRG